MVLISFLNPLSAEGKDIVREWGNLEGLSQDSPELIELVTRSPSQEISDDEEIPRNYLELAVKRIEWYVKKRSYGEFNNRRYAFLFNPEINKFDVISFYLLCQAIGVRFGPNSREARVMVESQGSLVQERLGKLPEEESRLLTDQGLQLLLEDRVHWTFFADLLSSRKINLPELILDHGELVLDQEDFIERYKTKIKNRNPDSMYQLLIGDKLKELILIKMIMQKTEDYIKNVHEKARVMVEPNPLLLELADKVAGVLSDSVQHYGHATGSRGVGSINSGPLNPQAFPPCVKKAMEGIKSGGRNDAILLFITPFISYARLYPDIFRMNVTKRVSDQDPDLQIVQNEILPLIYEAAQRCVPPLFEDQPQEKVNINAKLGFGLHELLKLKNEGETTWYTPMGCEKIKLHLPHLCRPDETCKKIGNPLTYYNRKSWEIGQETVENNGDNKDNSNSVQGNKKNTGNKRTGDNKLQQSKSALPKDIKSRHDKKNTRGKG
jgi:DNA primase large subunit